MQASHLFEFEFGVVSVLVVGVVVSVQVVGVQ